MTPAMPAQPRFLPWIGDQYATLSTAGLRILTVLATYRPDLVLACGRAVYERLELIDGLTSEPLFGEADGRRDPRERSRVIDVGSGRTGVVGMMYHPVSFGVRPAEWHPRVQRYLARAREVKARRSS